MTGLGRVFSKDIFPRVGLDILKVLAIGFTLYVGARKLLLDPLFSAPVETAYLGRFLHQAAVTFFGRLLVSLGLVAALSYAHQYYNNRREMMMTRQAVKDELRNVEADAKITPAQPPRRGACCRSRCSRPSRRPT